MVVYGWPRVGFEKCRINRCLNLFWNFASIQGVQGAIWEVPDPIPELKNLKKRFFNLLPKLSFFLIPPCGILNLASLIFAGPLFVDELRNKSCEN